MTKSIIHLFTLVLFLSFAKSTIKEKNEEQAQNKIEISKYSIVHAEYQQLADKALVHITNFQFHELHEMVSDDVEYYLPDGGETSSTKFVKKEAFISFWNSYKEKSGNTKMTLSNTVYLPINIDEKLNYKNTEGIMVLSYFSSDMEFGNEKIDLRMNFGFHFNDNKKIDKIYSYYDHTPIIETAKKNILN